MSLSLAARLGTRTKPPPRLLRRRVRQWQSERSSSIPSVTGRPYKYGKSPHLQKFQLSRGLLNTLSMRGACYGWSPYVDRVYDR